MRSVRPGQVRGRPGRVRAHDRRRRRRRRRIIFRFQWIEGLLHGAQLPSHMDMVPSSTLWFEWLNYAARWHFLTSFARQDDRFISWKLKTSAYIYDISSECQLDRRIQISLCMFFFFININVGVVRPANFSSRKCSLPTAHPSPAHIHMHALGIDKTNLTSSF